MRSASFQPVVAAAVYLDQHAFLRSPLSPRAIFGRTAFLWRAHSGIAQNALHAGPAEGQPLDFDQLLMQVGVIETGVSAAGQLDHLVPDLLGDRVGGLSRLVA